MPEAFDYNVFIEIPREYINPIYSGKGDEVKSLRIMKFIFHAHGYKNTELVVSKEESPIGWSRVASAQAMPQTRASQFYRFPLVFSGIPPPTGASL